MAVDSIQINWFNYFYVIIWLIVGCRPVSRNACTFIQNKPVLFTIKCVRWMKSARMVIDLIDKQKEQKKRYRTNRMQCNFNEAWSDTKGTKIQITHIHTVHFNPKQHTMISLKMRVQLVRLAFNRKNLCICWHN